MYKGLFAIILLVALPVNAQNVTTVVQGVVRDSVSHDPIPYVAIFEKGTGNGVLTNEKGEFKLVASETSPTIKLSSMGYEKKELTLKNGGNNIVIELLPVGVTLSEVKVKPKKEKYSKKNNPAVEFMEKIVANRDVTDPRRNENYNYDKYERITIGLNDFTDDAQNGRVFKQFPFLSEYVDTSEVSGKPVLNISVKEKISEVSYRRDPKSEKEYVTGIRRAGLDDITDLESMQTLLEDAFREIDLYDNDINILQNRFVSPLSRLAPDFYKFYMTDTVEVDNERCVVLSFAPRNPKSFGFTGHIYVLEGDSTMFIKRVIMNVPPSINLNFIDQLVISQEFDRAPDGSRLKTKDDMTVEISVLPGMQGMYTRRNTAYRNHNFDPPKKPELFSDMRKTIIADDAYVKDDTFWANERMLPIGKNEKRVESLVAKLRKEPIYYWTEKVVKVLVSGYIPTGENSKWDFGPMNTLISGNTVEGARFRVGGITTANLNPYLFASGYVAYGTKDGKFKYDAELVYSFNKKKYHPNEFPIHSLKLSHLYDIDQLGQQYLFTNKDNVFLSLKRKENTQMTYHRKTTLEYKLELYNNFSVVAGISHDRQEATRYLPFVNGKGESFSHYGETSLNIELRYAPGEKFYQTKNYRYPINLDAPVFVLMHTYAPKGFLGSMFTVNKTEFSVQKRFWFSAFGYTDIILKTGHVWNRAAYPDLLIPNANLSYTIQPESYSLMNPLEFVNDTYASWDITYWANGAIFNYVPLLKKLDLREVFSFRGLYGHLSDKNNPKYNADLFQFPADTHTVEMSSTPYMEAGVGIDNIFKVLRIDYVWRLNYRHAEDIKRGGVRIAMHFTF